MEWLALHWFDIVQALGLICLGASGLAKLTPTEVDDNLIGKFIKFLDVVAINNKPTITK